GAVLAAADQDHLDLEQKIEIKPSDLIPHAPVTEQHLDAPMAIADLCMATIDMSDNTAANLLIKALGGPEKVTDFFRSLGDSESRLDRYEPELNLSAESDLRDTTTPLAMAHTLETLLIEDFLAANS
ncbi:serine hydrolase, partial [Ochrobactrum sp. SFR4]|uniref:serine hydrolase n=1 Tax=Ochrobactrum sp. SFR4 TaxID=2717368 RepID=UPI001C8CB9D0